MRVRALMSFADIKRTKEQPAVYQPGDEFDIPEENLALLRIKAGLVEAVRQMKPVQTATKREPEKAVV